MTVYGYTRVSTGRQELSLEIQTDRLHAWARSRGDSMKFLFTDDGESAATLSRPRLHSLLSQIGSGDTLVVVKLDRLTRRVRDLLDLIDRSQKEGWAIVSIEESLDTTTPIGRAIVKVLATFAELEREQVSDRTKAALAQRKSQNRLTSRFTPFGWRLADGNWDASQSTPEVRKDFLVEHDKEKALVVNVSSNWDYPTLALADMLNSRGFTNPRTGQPVNARTIETIRAMLRAEED